MGSTLSVTHLQGLTSGSDANTIYLDSGHDLHAPGHMIQMTHTLFQTQETYSIAQAAYGAYSSLTATITPKFATSKIFGIINLDGVTWTSDGSYGRFKVYRGSTEIQEFGYPRSWGSVDNSSGTTMTTHFYDSPATTSAVTYKFRFYSNYSTSNFNINRDSVGDSTFTLQEIAQ